MNEYHPDELIGSALRIIHSTNPGVENLKGKIVDETKHTFKILTNNKEEKTILKKGTIFKINGKNVEGDQILHRPEERIKFKK